MLKRKIETKNVMDAVHIQNQIGFLSTIGKKNCEDQIFCG